MAMTLAQLVVLQTTNTMVMSSIPDSDTELIKEFTDERVNSGTDKGKKEWMNECTRAWKGQTLGHTNGLMKETVGRKWHTHRGTDERGKATNESKGTNAGTKGMNARTKETVGRKGWSNEWMNAQRDY